MSGVQADRQADALNAIKNAASFLVVVALIFVISIFLARLRVQFPGALLPVLLLKPFLVWFGYGPAVFIVLGLFLRPAPDWPERLRALAVFPLFLAHSMLIVFLTDAWGTPMTGIEAFIIGFENYLLEWLLLAVNDTVAALGMAPLSSASPPAVPASGGAVVAVVQWAAQSIWAVVLGIVSALIVGPSVGPIVKRA